MNVSSPIINEREITQASPAHFEAELDRDSCLKIIEYCKYNIKMEKASFGGSNPGQDVLDNNVRKSEIGWIKHNTETKFLFDKILEKTNQINKFYNFQLTGITEDIQFTSYSGNENEHFDWHLDMGGGFKSRRKLSLVIQLSHEDDYEGGELLVDAGAKDGKPLVSCKKQGSMIFFPSYLLHKVTPVTSGHRYSLVSWLSGQPYL